MRNRYKSKAFRAAHEIASDMYRAGLLEEVKMREFDETCLVPSLTPAEIRALREREAMGREEFARELSVSASLVGRWERGESVPSPLATKILDLMRRKGLEAIR